MTPARSADRHVNAAALRFWRVCLGLWFGCVTIATHWPRTDYLDPTHRPPDKVAHFIVMGALAFLCERARLLPRGWMAICLVAIWVPIDEWTQDLMSDSRETSLEDVLGGLIGVATAAVVLACLKPSSSARLGGRWHRAIQAVDEVAAKPSGGPLIAVTCVVVGLVSFPAIYAVIWFTTGTSAGLVSMLGGIALALLASWPILRRAWRSVDGPRWPMPGGAGWAMWLVFLSMGWMIGRLIADSGIEGLVAPMTMAGGVAGIALVLRAGWSRTGSGR